MHIKLTTIDLPKIELALNNPINDIPIQLHCSDSYNFLDNLWMQAGGYGSAWNKPWTYEDIIDQISFEFNERIRIMSELYDFSLLKNNSSVLDIGAGNSLVTMILHQIIGQGKFYLLDKDLSNIETSPWINSPLRKYYYYDQTGVRYPFYNKWASVIDTIEQTPLINKENFSFLDTTTEWPGELDLITSWYSCGFHYPVDVYWERILKNLKVGGQLFLTIVHYVNADVIDMISDTLECKPKWTTRNTPVPTDLIMKDRSMTREKFEKEFLNHYCWVRNK